MDDLINLHDFEAAARRAVEPAAFDYFAGGAMDEITLRDNRAAFDRLRLRPRVFVDVSRRELATTVLGRELALPVLVAPIGFQGLAHPEAEAAAARGAGLAGAGYVLSTFSSAPFGAVRAATQAPLWFQLYVHRDRGLTREIVAHAETAGCEALVVTADAPFLGRRERDVRAAFRIPMTFPLANLPEVGREDLATAAGDSGVAHYFATQIDPGLTWSDLAWLRSVTALPVLVKGICRGDDARRAAAQGAAAVIVSNHGGRQLDGTVATVDALREVVEAAGGEVEILVDGGVRRGTDVLKALALGARAVLVGRPAVWGLAVGGAEGVRRVLELLRDELDLALALAGCPSVRDVGCDLLAE